MEKWWPRSCSPKRGGKSVRLRFSAAHISAFYHLHAPSRHGTTPCSIPLASSGKNQTTSRRICCPKMGLPSAQGVSCYRSGNRTLKERYRAKQVWRISPYPRPTWISPSKPCKNRRSRVHPNYHHTWSISRYKRAKVQDWRICPFLKRCPSKQWNSR